MRFIVNMADIKKEVVFSQEQKKLIKEIIKHENFSHNDWTKEEKKESLEALRAYIRKHYRTEQSRKRNALIAKKTSVFDPRQIAKLSTLHQKISIRITCFILKTYALLVQIVMKLNGIMTL